MASVVREDEHLVVPIDVQGHTKAGNDLSGRALWLYQLRDGKIAELWVDTAKAVAAVS